MAVNSYTERIIIKRDGVGIFASIFQKQKLRFSRIFVDRPALIVLRNGQKKIRTATNDWTIKSGEAIAVAGGQLLDIINCPNDSGEYQAQWLIWDSSIIEQSTSCPLEKPSCNEAAPIKNLDPAFFEAFDRARASISLEKEIPLEIAQHRVKELIIWLSLRNIIFRSYDNPSLSTQIRRLIETAPAQKWTIASIAKQLKLSEATLRRQVSFEGETVGGLLTDSRMTLAMTLLQSTDAPVSRIAIDVGYESASRFAIRFRERFGFAPTSIRGHSRN